MRLAVNYIFGLLVALLYILGASAIFVGFITTKGYSATNFSATVFELTLGGITAFLVTTLGLAVANDQTKVAPSLRKATSGDATKTGGEWLIGVIAGIYLIVGFTFVILAVFPDHILAGQTDGKAYADAPPYLATQAKAFVGVILGGLTAAGAALKAA